MLERAIFELSTKGAKNPGRLKVAEDTVEQAKAAVEQGELALSQLEHDRDTLSGALERRTETDGSLAERRSHLILPSGTYFCLDRDELRDTVAEAWLTRAQKRVAKAWLAENSATDD